MNQINICLPDACYNIAQICENTYLLHEMYILLS